MTTPALGSIPERYFDAGSHVPTGELAELLNKARPGYMSVSIRAQLDTTNVYRYVHKGPAATLASLTSVITGALTTGDATATAAIGGTAVTGGVLTITQASSAAGDIDSVSPTAANALVDGDVLTLTVGGTNDATEFADITVALTY